MNDDQDLQPEPLPAMYEHRPPVAVARAHVTRYPRHYGALGLFLVAMLTVPTVGGATLADLAAAPTGSVPTAEPAVSAPAPASGPAASAARPTDPATQVADLFDVSPRTVSGAVDRAPAPGVSVPPPAPAPGGGDDAAPPPDDGDGLEDAVPGGAAIPPPPALPLPSAPDELQPLLGVVAPLTSTGCSGLGLAAVVAAVAGTAAQDVPVGQLLPYLAPVYSACATFPPASADPTICAIDEAAHEAGYPQDVSGLAKTPNAIGTGIDVLYGIESAIEAYTGQAPGLVAGIAEQLGCR